jgi:hypothetical protein
VQKLVRLAILDMPASKRQALRARHSNFRSLFPTHFADVKSNMSGAANGITGRISST